MTTDSNGHTIRILHLDDNKSDGEILAYHLKRSEFPCAITFVQTEAAYRTALTRKDFDIILSDLILRSVG